MKKFYSLLLILPFIGFGQNLVENGDFETWDSEGNPSGWFLYNNDKPMIIESSDAHEGASAVLINNTTTSKISLSQRVPNIEAGKTYKVTLWYKVLSGDDTDARIWSKWRDDNGYISDDATADQLLGPNNSYFTSSTDWQEYTTDVKAPAGATTFQFEVRGYGGSQTLWDGFSLECLDCSNMGTADINNNSNKLKVVVAQDNLVFKGSDVKAVEVYNLNGQKVANSTYVGGLAKGVYVAVVEDNKGNKTSVKFIK